MELKNLKQIKDERYDLNTALVLIIENSNNTFDKKIEKFISDLEQTLLNKVYINELTSKKVFENIDDVFISKIKMFSENDEYKKITAEEIRGYAYFIYKCLLFEYKEFSYNNIAKFFTIAINIFSPKEIIDFMNNELLRINQGMRY